MGKNKHPIECICQRTEREKQETLISQQKHNDLVRRLKAEGFSDPSMLDWTFENDNRQNPQMQLAQRYVNHWPEMREKNVGLLLWGGVGTGKSYMAGCIANALMEQGISVMMTNFSRILNELTKYHADKNEIIAGLVSYPLLVIDDLGIERNSEFALEMIYNVVDRRYCTRKPLIVTTNLSYQDMTRKDLDIEHQRIYSRLMEMCFPVIYQGKDQRQKERDLKLEWMKLNGD